MNQQPLSNVSSRPFASLWLLLFIGSTLAFVAQQVQAEFIGGLDRVSASSTFELGNIRLLPALGWSNISSTARIFDTTGNGALIGTQPYANYEVQYDTGVAVAPWTTYTLALNMGFMADRPGGAATFRLTLGVVTPSGGFTALADPLTGTVSYKGNLFHGIVSAAATQTVATASSVPTGLLAVRWAQTSTRQNYSDYFGIDNVTLDAQVIPEPCTGAAASIGIIALLALIRRRLAPRSYEYR